jgi:hypothetical protein
MPNTKSVAIEELYVVVGKDSNGSEGVAVGYNTITGAMEPLMGHRRRVPRILELAQALSDESGQELHLVKFSKRGVLQKIAPKNTDEDRD